MQYILAAYEVDRVYGGPEEGGWWFNTGRLERVIGVEHDEDAAYAKARRANGLLRFIQRGYRRDIGSVCYEGGAYEVDVLKPSELVPFYPTERPHYE